MNEISSQICMITMLSNKLYSLFIQYISNGRIRAPPEADLICLKSTFQLGAKTDRRAVQSKFKSWAKRMLVINNKLLLLNSGKEIIPQEKCCEVVMSIHSDTHLSIERVITLIQEKYTWSRKNFGMEKTMVTECILRNCSSPDCRRQIENEISKRHCVDNFIKDVILASESPNGLFQNQLSSSLFTMNDAFLTKTSLYPWPMLLPFKKENYNPFIYQDDHKGKSILSNCSFIKERYNDCVEQVPNTLKNVSTVAKNEENFIFKKPKKVTKSSGTFRKPKNIQDFLVLIHAAELSPRCHPLILKEEKTNFLGGLGLVPRTICSKRTLLKFEKEKKRKTILERQHMLYHKNRKTLRDRNKLNKIKLKEQREKRAYLEISRRQTCIKPEMSISGDEKPICKDKDNGVEISKIISKKSSRNEIDFSEISSSHKNNHSAEILCIIKKDDCQRQKQLDFCYNRNSSNSDNLVISDSFSSNTCKTANFSRPEKCAKINGIREQTQNVMNISQLKTDSFPHPKLKPYLMPSNMTGEIAILPSPQNKSTKPFRGDKPKSYVPNKAVNKNYGSKLVSERDTYSILQPISNVMKLKTIHRNHLVTPCSNRQTSKVIDSFRLKNTKKNVTVPNETSSTIEVSGCSSKLIDNENFSETLKMGTPLQTRGHNQNILKISQNILDHSGTSYKNKMYVDNEMNKLSKWIQMMRSSMAHSIFSFNVQKSSQKLLSQLNAGIALVRKIRQKLYELEKLETQTTSPRLY